MLTFRCPPRFVRNLQSAICNLRFAIILSLFVLFPPAALKAQDSSLFSQPDPRMGMTLAKFSWTYQQPVEPHPIRLHDIITVQVDEKSVVNSEGQMDRKKKRTAI